VIVIIALLVVIVGVVAFFVIKSWVAAPVLSDAESIGMTNDATPDFTFSSTKAGTISYSGDCSSSTTTITKGSNTITFNKLNDGNHTNCQITAGSGTKQSVLKVPNFLIDTIKPLTTVSSDYKNGDWAKNASFSFSCSDSGSGCSGGAYYKINNGDEQVGNTLSFNTEGIYSLEYWSLDNAENEETHHTEYNNIKIYSSIPGPNITTLTGYRNSSFSLTYNATDSNDNCYYTFNDSVPQDYGACSGTFDNVNFSSDGNYTILIYENDSVGKTGVTDPIVISWDTTLPVVNISNINNGDLINSTTSSSMKINLNYSIDTATCQYSLDNVSWLGFTGCSDTGTTLGQILTPSTNEQAIYVKGIDNAGNLGNTYYVLFYYKS